MKDLIAFASYVRPEVPGCPEIQILDAIRRSGAEFCMRTSVSRQTVSVVTAPGVSSYDLVGLLPTGFMPDKVQRVQDSTMQYLQAASEEEFDRRFLRTQSGTPRYYYLDGSQLVVGYKPTGVDTLTVRVKTRVSEAATQLPDELYERYHEEIAAGAKKVLMMMANTPWSNIQQAGIYKGMYDEAIDIENLRYAKGGGSRTLRTKLHIF